MIPCAPALQPGSYQLIWVDTATTVVTAPKTEMSLITRAPLLIQHCCTRTQTRSAVGVSSSFWVVHIFGPYGRQRRGNAWPQALMWASVVVMGNPLFEVQTFCPYRAHDCLYQILRLTKNQGLGRRSCGIATGVIERAWEHGSGFRTLRGEGDLYESHRSGSPDSGRAMRVC